MLKRHRHLPQGLAIASQSPEFWRRIAPELTISDSYPAIANDDSQPSAETHRMRLLNTGYLHVKVAQPYNKLPKIAEAMQRLVDAGMPAGFIGVYDEVWTLIAQSSSLIAAVFNGNGGMVPNFWASHGDQNIDLSAKRRRPGNGIFSDGTAKNITVCIPVTDATAENGCIYVVPAGQDRNYGKGVPDRADASLSGIRALPAKAGDVLIWTGETYHWRGRRDPAADSPSLLSLTWEFQSREIPPLDEMIVPSFPYVPFETRLGLLARQMAHRQGDHQANPVWRAVQQTLANRFPMAAAASRA